MNPKQHTTTGKTNGRLWGLSSQDWANIQEQTCRPVYLAAFEKLNLNETSCYLDVGCGSGMAAALAYQQGAKVHGVDASQALIEIAEQRSPNGSFHVSDIEKLPFEDSRFSCITGFNSFQYAGDPIAALSEAKRVAKPGAAVLIMTWGEPEGMQAASLVAALKPLLPAPPKGDPGPFALSNKTMLREFALESGLKPIEIFDVESPWRYADLDTALRGLASSGVAAKAVENTSHQALDQAHRQALAPFKNHDGSYHIGATFRCLYASA
ncbi:class I SAM-dependent methyltransferase [Agarivorans sp. Alg241-V36]|uniref:class I SAM-dependent methyltransferase n=1 Tax=Agarivorans sp. Alg241-V36 TaxID=2305992 RepID=UPI0013CF954C|nr:class I SAM-dependent methyltransferase [Agarivorans sp. Alg241-V36]